MIEKTCLVQAIVDLLSFASPGHSLFNPDMYGILPDGDPMLLLTENDLDSIHQFVSKPDDGSDLHIILVVSSFCTNAKSWLERNPGVNDLSVSLNEIIYAIDNSRDELKKDAAANFETPEMERETLSADNGQQSNSRDGKRLKKSDEQQEKNSVLMGLPLEHDDEDAVMLE